MTYSVPSSSQATRPAATGKGVTFPELASTSASVGSRASNPSVENANRCPPGAQSAADGASCATSCITATV
jgi:hypothetical protein